MRIALAVSMAALLASPLARAGVTGELDAGTGAESRSPGYVTANAALSAALDGPPHGPDLSVLGPVQIFLLYGADPADRNGLRADASVLAYGTSQDRTASVIGTASASARGWGWQLDAAVTLQPVGDLRDRFWRSGRDVVASTFGFEMPAAITVAVGPDRVAWAPARFTFADRSRLDGGAAPEAGGTDISGEVTGMRWNGMHHELDIFDVHITAYDKLLAYSESATETTSSGISAEDVGLDIASLDWQVSDALELRGYAGVDDLEPMQHYTETMRNDMVSDQTLAFLVETPRYGLEVTHRAGDRTITASAGSWARLDPTGNAADAGQLATASYADRFGRLRISASVEAGRLRRRLIGPLATTPLAPAGTRMWMGRGELSASLRLAPDLDVAATAWLERSDRDDPRWLEPATGALATHAGADVSARWQLPRI